MWSIRPSTFSSGMVLLRTSGSAGSCACTVKARTAARTNRVNRFIRFPGLFATVTEIVKQSHAIGLGPYADHARVGKRFVFPLESLFAIERHGEMIVTEIHTKRVPLAGSDF